MVRRFILVAIRNLLNHRITSFVNILGLAIGMTAFILIIQYVRYELSYDDFHVNQDRIYRIQQDRYNKGEITTRWAAGCSAVGQALYENFPEVENFTRFQIWNGVFSKGEKKFREEEIYIADTSFFEVFSFKLLEGDPKTILVNPLDMVISESVAQKYFGDENPIGESLRFNGGVDLQITGIFGDVPKNSHLKTDFVVSWATAVQFQGAEINTAWQWDGFFNYILLNPASEYKQFEIKIADFVEEEIAEDMKRWNAGGIRRINEGPEESNQYRIIGFDFNFVEFYGLSILEGRNFSEDFGQNSETVLFNESAIQIMGFEDYASAMNVPIYFWGDTFNIVGVVKDYHQEGLKEVQEPLIFRFFQNASGFYSIRLNPDNIQGVLTEVENQWEVFFSQNPFEYFFLEDYYNEQYLNETSFLKVFSLFALLAIVIACLGLYGLSSYTTMQRTREIGIRKVLGASSGNAVGLLLRYFIIQVLIAVPIGLGLGYYFMAKWLRNFPFQISIGWWFFLVPVLLVVIIALITVSSQVIKTANVNPADSLRYE
jgi:hypothetical protein